MIRYSYPKKKINYSEVSIDPAFSTRLLYLPSHSGGSVGSLQLENQFLIAGWFSFSTAVSILYELNNNFTLTYSKTEECFLFNRKYYNLETTIQQSENIDLDLNESYYIELTRDFYKLELKVNLQIAAEWYLPYNLTLDTFNLSPTSLFGIYSSIEHRKSIIELDSVENILVQDNNTASYILALQDKQETVKLLGGSTYNPVEKLWLASPQGFHVNPDASITKPKTYTLEFAFTIDNSKLLNSSIFSLCSCPGNYYFSYNPVTNNVVFNYLTTSFLSVNIGTIEKDKMYFIALQSSSTVTQLYLNGFKVMQSNTALPALKTLKFGFNTNIYSINNTSNSFLLHNFLLSPVIKYSKAYIPFLIPKQNKIERVFNLKTRANRIKYSSRTRSTFDYQVSYSSIVIGNNAITISRSVANYPETFKISAFSDKEQEFVPADFNYPETVTFLAEEYTKTFVFTLNSYAVNPFKKQFILSVSNSRQTKNYSVTVNDIRPYTLSPTTGLAGYLTGFAVPEVQSNPLQLQAVSGGQLLNAAQPSEDSLYGKVYKLDATNYLTSPADISNVRTAVFLYKEINPVSKRGYIGSNSDYSFNGGASQELVGNLELISNVYLTALEVSNKTNSMAISSDDSTLAIVDNSTYKLLIFSKTSLGIWSSTPLEINTGLISNTLASTSIDINSNGTVILLGIKNANNGEGVVQLYRKTGSTWNKELHLGSPLVQPNIGGFGTSVALTDSGNKIFASQPGANTVYQFEKTGLWSAIPTHTFTGSSSYGSQISCNNIGDLLSIVSLDSQAVQINRFTGSSWTVDTTFNGLKCKLHPTLRKLVSSNFLTKTVSVYTKPSSTWTLQRQFIEPTITNYGYDIDIDADANVYISSPEQKQVVQYSENDSWSGPVQTFSKNVDFFGYSITANIFSLVVSNNIDTLYLTTKSAASVPSNVEYVRQNYVTALPTDKLNTNDLQILTFVFNTSLKINQIGKTNTDLYLNGLFKGCFFFNRKLTLTEIAEVENNVSKFLSIGRNSLNV